MAFLNNSTTLKTETWFSASNQWSYAKNLSELRTIYDCSLHPNLCNPDNFPTSAKNSYLQYKKAYNKKPWFAAILSAVIPGLGKLYAGKTRSFFTTLILNAAYATQTIESEKKLGPAHFFSIINAGAFTAFYFSNIYGSYLAVKQRKKEFRKQFLIEATRYYN